jgi:uncharacterized membrane protein YdfJ with MMPL/SSD domain
MITAWILAGLTAAWFGWVARRAGRAWVLWAAGGALLALAITTVSIGLGEASSIPFSNQEARAFRLKEVGIAICLVVVIGLGATKNLYTQRGNS